MDTTNTERQQRNRRRKRELKTRPTDIQGAFDRMEITLSLIPSTLDAKPRLNVCYDFQTVEDRQTLEDYSARQHIDLETLLDDTFRVSAARYLKGPLGATEFHNGGELKGRIMGRG